MKYQRILNCYQQLDLPYGANHQEIAQASRDLLNVWSVPAFKRNAHLLGKASAKRKRVEEARTALLSFSMLEIHKAASKYAGKTGRAPERIVRSIEFPPEYYQGFTYLSGVFLAAQGQLIRATLDVAVNTSPLLRDEDKIKLMELE